jgi:hypothetical protein
MKKLLKISIQAARTAVVILVVMAIVVSGAGVAHRVCADSRLAVEVVEENPSDVRLVAGPPDSDQAPEQMSPDGKPTTEQPARLVLSALSKYSNQDDRSKYARGISIVSISSLSGAKSHYPISTSTNLVSSDLGKQFTLVGARPSGTS